MDLQIRINLPESICLRCLRVAGDSSRPEDAESDLFMAGQCWLSADRNVQVMSPIALAWEICRHRRTILATVERIKKRDKIGKYPRELGNCPTCP